MPIKTVRQVMITGDCEETGGVIALSEMNVGHCEDVAGENNHHVYAFCNKCGKRYCEFRFFSWRGPGEMTTPPAK